MSCSNEQNEKMDMYVTQKGWNIHWNNHVSQISNTQYNNNKGHPIPEQYRAKILSTYISVFEY